MAQRLRTIPQERSRSSFPLPPAGRPISQAGSSLTSLAAILVRNLWWRMSGVPAAPRERFAPLARRPTDTRSCPVTSAPMRLRRRSTRIWATIRKKDFAPIGLTTEYPELLVVRKDFPANNLKEFVAYAKSNPDKLNVGHAGLGSVSYIGCLLLHAAIGIKPTMIPFTGTAPVLNAMLAGQVDYECDPVLGTLSQVQAGNVKALAVAAKKRSPLLPDVPTSHEQGLPEFDIAPFYAVFAPSGTPQAVVDKLADALNKGLNEEAVQKRLTELGADSVEPSRRGPKALADLIKSEAARLMPILKAATEK